MRTHANRLTDLARDLHATYGQKKKTTLSFAPPVGDRTDVEPCCSTTDCDRTGEGSGHTKITPSQTSRAEGIWHTSLAYKKQALDMGYSHSSVGPSPEDSDDGGQGIFEEFLLIELTSLAACPKLLLLADRTRKVASSWDQKHSQLSREEAKAINASPTKGLKTMSKAVGAPLCQLAEVRQA